MAAAEYTMGVSSGRFRIYSIDKRDGEEMVRWTDTELRKDHYDPIDRLLNRFEIGADDLAAADAAAFQEARGRILRERRRQRGPR